MTGLTVSPHAHNFGARVEGIHLADDLSESTAAELRELWLLYQVLYFPEQPLSHAQLEQFRGYLGSPGEEPYVKPIDGHPSIIEVRREPDEQASPFGGSWHSDWSFLAAPPSATILHAKTIPPRGGDTLFADGYRAYEGLDPGWAAELESLTAIHSARRPYTHEGYERSGGRQRSMTILPSDQAWATQEHPLVRTHPETGRKVLWINPVYTIGIKELRDQEADALLTKLFAHALQPDYVYTHQWASNMLTMWDNRSVQHCAQGGYDGHRRVMHRTTVAGSVPA